MRYLITLFSLFLANIVWQGFTDCDFAFAIIITYFQGVAALVFWLQDKFIFSGNTAIDKSRSGNQ